MNIILHALSLLVVVQCVTRPVTSLGHQVGRSAFWEGPKFF